ncbi:hypothetical protein T492DRAFT_1095075 [Pavlovales sp. CCMP2436]|nr:hypothetical protein T492DRAFT_1095075 [Pavlovales sp. CCMP2436]
MLCDALHAATAQSAQSGQAAALAALSTPTAAAATADAAADVAAAAAADGFGADAAAELLAGESEEAALPLSCSVLVGKACLEQSVGPPPYALLLPLLRAELESKAWSSISSSEKWGEWQQLLHYELDGLLAQLGARSHLLVCPARRRWHALGAAVTGARERARALSGYACEFEPAAAWAVGELCLEEGDCAVCMQPLFPPFRNLRTQPGEAGARGRRAGGTGALTAPDGATTIDGATATAATAASSEDVRSADFAAAFGECGECSGSDESAASSEDSDGAAAEHEHDTQPTEDAQTEADVAEASAHAGGVGSDGPDPAGNQSDMLGWALARATPAAANTPTARAARRAARVRRRLLRAAAARRQEVAVLACGHGFHVCCAEEWAWREGASRHDGAHEGNGGGGQRASCPCCRAPTGAAAACSAQHSAAARTLARRAHALLRACGLAPWSEAATALRCGGDACGSAAIGPAAIGPIARAAASGLVGALRLLEAATSPTAPAAAQHGAVKEVGAAELALCRLLAHTPLDLARLAPHAAPPPPGWQPSPKWARAASGAPWPALGGGATGVALADAVIVRAATEGAAYGGWFGFPSAESLGAAAALEASLALCSSLRLLAADGAHPANGPRLAAALTALGAATECGLLASMRALRGLSSVVEASADAPCARASLAAVGASGLDGGGRSREGEGSREGNREDISGSRSREGSCLLEAFGTLYASLHASLRAADSRAATQSEEGAGGASAVRRALCAERLVYVPTAGMRKFSALVWTDTIPLPHQHGQPAQHQAQRSREPASYALSLVGRKATGSDPPPPPPSWPRGALRCAGLHALEPAYPGAAAFWTRLVHIRGAADALSAARALHALACAQQALERGARTATATQALTRRQRAAVAYAHTRGGVGGASAELLALTGALLARAERSVTGNKRTALALRCMSLPVWPAGSSGGGARELRLSLAGCCVRADCDWLLALFDADVEPLTDSLMPPALLASLEAAGRITPISAATRSTQTISVDAQGAPTADGDGVTHATLSAAATAALRSLAAAGLLARARVEVRVLRYASAFESEYELTLPDARQAPGLPDSPPGLPDSPPGHSDSPPGLPDSRRVRRSLRAPFRLECAPRAAAGLAAGGAGQERLGAGAGSGALVACGRRGGSCDDDGHPSDGFRILLCARAEAAARSGGLAELVCDALEQLLADGVRNGAPFAPRALSAATGAEGEPEGGLGGAEGLAAQWPVRSVPGDGRGVRGGAQGNALRESALGLRLRAALAEAWPQQPVQQPPVPRSAQAAVGRGLGRLGDACAKEQVTPQPRSPLSTAAARGEYGEGSARATAAEQPRPTAGAIGPPRHAAKLSANGPAALGAGSHPHGVGRGVACAGVDHPAEEEGAQPAEARWPRWERDGQRVRPAAEAADDSELATQHAHAGAADEALHGRACVAPGGSIDEPLSETEAGASSICPLCGSCVSRPAGNSADNGHGGGLLSEGSTSDGLLEAIGGVGL